MMMNTLDSNYLMYFTLPMLYFFPNASFTRELPAVYIELFWVKEFDNGLKTHASMYNYGHPNLHQ